MTVARLVSHRAGVAAAIGAQVARAGLSSCPLAIVVGAAFAAFGSAALLSAAIEVAFRAVAGGRAPGWRSGAARAGSAAARDLRVVDAQPAAHVLPRRATSHARVTFWHASVDAGLLPGRALCRASVAIAGGNATGHGWARLTRGPAVIGRVVRLAGAAARVTPERACLIAAVPDRPNRCIRTGGAARGIRAAVAGTGINWILSVELGAADGAAQQEQKGERRVAESENTCHDSGPIGLLRRPVARIRTAGVNQWSAPSRPPD